MVTNEVARNKSEELWVIRSRVWFGRIQLTVGAASGSRTFAVHRWCVPSAGVQVTHGLVEVGLQVRM